MNLLSTPHLRIHAHVVTSAPYLIHNKLDDKFGAYQTATDVFSRAVDRIDSPELLPLPLMRDRNIRQAGWSCDDN